MGSIPRVGAYLDTRYSDKDGLFTVKLRVGYMRRTKYFKTDFKISESAWQKSYLAKYPKGKAGQFKGEIEDLVNRGKKIIKGMESFSFEEFESVYYKMPKGESGVLSYYDLLIKEYRDNKKYNTMDTYVHSKAWVEKCLCDGSSDDLKFEMITPKSLESMENQMITSGLKDGTISIYLRCLRRVYNRAIKDQIVDKKCYPFDSPNANGYKIPSWENRKRPLKITHIKELIHYAAIKDSARERAKDFWLLTFYCNGMNIHDLLHLQNQNYDGEKITFIRGKTEDRSKRRIRIEVEVMGEAQAIIERYRNDDRDKDSFLMPILDHSMNDLEKRRIVKNTTRSISQGLKKIAKEIGLPDGVSTIWARHSFSNLAKNQGASTEFIKESLGHTDIRTTELYLDSFDDEVRREMTKKVFEGL